MPQTVVLGALLALLAGCAAPERFRGFLGERRTLARGLVVRAIVHADGTFTWCPESAVALTPSLVQGDAVEYRWRACSPLLAHFDGDTP